MAESLGKGTAYLMGAEVIFVLSNYLVHISLAHFLGIELYGIFGVLMSLYLINRAFLNTGLPKAVSKFIAESKDIAPIVRSSFKLQLLFAGVFALLYILLAPAIAWLLGDTSLTSYIRVLGIMVVPLAIQSLYSSGYLNGLRLFKRQAFVKSVYPLLKTVFVLLFVLAGFQLWGVLVGMLIAVTIGVFLAIKLVPLPVRFAHGTNMKPIILFALPMTITALAFASMRNINVLFLKALEDNTAAALYTSALTISNLPFLVFSAVPLALMPSISRAVALQQRELTQKYIRQSMRYALLLLLPLTAMLSATSEGILKLFYPDAYAAAAPILSILLYSATFLVLLTILGSVISGSGNPKTEMVIIIIFISIMMLLNILFIPSFGLLGAALSSLVTSVLGFTVAAIIVYKKFSALLRWQTVVNCVIASAIVFALGYLWHVSGILLLPMYAFLGIVYLAMLLCLGEIHTSDVQTVRKIFQKKREEAANRTVSIIAQTKLYSIWRNYRNR